MGLKLTIRDTDEEQEYVQPPAAYMQPMQPMYPVHQGYPMQAYQQPRPPKGQSRNFTETVTRHLMTDDPMLKLSDHAKSKGLDLHPALIAGVCGAIAWVMFKDALVVGAIAAAAYFVFVAGKKKTGA